MYYDPTNLPAPDGPTTLNARLGDLPCILWEKSQMYAGEGDFAACNEIPHMTDHDLSYPWASGYRPQFVSALKQETKWYLVKPLPTIDESRAKEIAEDAASCTYCKGRGSLWVACIGDVTDLLVKRQVPCPCRALTLFWSVWQTVPTVFQDVRLEDLRPYDRLVIPTEKQAKIIKYVQDHPDYSYFLTGKPRSGKSHTAYALYRRKVWQWAQERGAMSDCTPGCWHSTTYDLLDAWLKYSKVNWDDPPSKITRPVVFPNEVRAAVKQGIRPVLLLDELDKWTPSDGRKNNLHELLNAVWESKGQNIVLSNKDEAGLGSKWGDEDFAGGIIRRISGDENSTHIKF